ncbi:hypothetical protein PR202_gb14025 [Eleusine coracana subsp. coracana]|uniref:Uncharacterized protein n=1 Tax=Eleusine coracana subsp. coracana TaxID=191504 RepID=A0AAV5EUP2_ELECO|nr:hypothetical protein QOZ80_4BG0331070 [Eleusine coracana subsp. coracana]GJN26122.1 hypothetical protein PR202_gb14025 [Eleusine coracana subsp. coracana]
MSSILQSHVYPRFGRVFRALARFKSLLLDALGKTKRPGGVPWSSSRGKKHAISYHARSKIASFMMTKPHSSSWAGGSSSSAPAKKKLDVSHDSAAWNVVVPAGAVDGAGEYCGYLRWLEEEETHADEVLVVEEEEDDVDHAAGGGSEFNEIDRLAEKFIARCHAKFLLEKQESYRRYQEMMARSV